MCILSGGSDMGNGMSLGDHHLERKYKEGHLWDLEEGKNRKIFQGGNPSQGWGTLEKRICKGGETCHRKEAHCTEREGRNREIPQLVKQVRKWDHLKQRNELGWGEEKLWRKCAKIEIQVGMGGREGRGDDDNDLFHKALWGLPIKEIVRDEICLQELGTSIKNGNVILLGVQINLYVSLGTKVWKVRRVVCSWFNNITVTTVT